MLLQTYIGIAFKDLFNDYKVVNISLFDIKNINKYFSNVHMKINRNVQLKVKVMCPICGKYHYYTYNINDLLKDCLIIGGCEQLGEPIFFMGNIKNVEDKINSYRLYNKKVYAIL